MVRMAKKESKKGSLILEARGRFVNNKDRRKDCRLDRSTLSGPSRERIGGPVLKEREKERRGDEGVPGFLKCRSVIPDRLVRSVAN